MALEVTLSKTETITRASINWICITAKVPLQARMLGYTQGSGVRVENMDMANFCTSLEIYMKVWLIERIITMCTTVYHSVTLMFSTA
jgi:hypothetical protein